MFELPPIHFAADVPGEQAANASIRDLMLVGDLLNRAARQLTQQRIGESFGAVSLRVVPVAALGGRRLAFAIQAAIPLRAQVEHHLPLADWKMAQAQGFAMFKELGRLLTAAVTDGKAACRFEITSDLSLADLDIQDADRGEVQQLLNRDIHSDLPDGCGVVTTLS